MDVLSRLAIGQLALVFIVFACKRPQIGGQIGRSETSSTDSDELSQIEHDISPEAPEQARKFSLVKFIKSKESLKALHSYIDPEQTKLSVGDKAKFYLETDATLEIGANVANSLNDRQIIGVYWMRGYILNKLMTNANNPSGLIVDMGATATLNKLAMEAHFRYLGADIVSKTITAGFDQSFVRDFEVKAGADAFIVGVEAGGRMGGEVGMKAEFGIRKDDVLNLIFTPRASMVGGVLGGARLLAGLAALNVEGETKLIDLKVRGNANLGVLPKTDLLYADIGIDGGDIKLNDGKIDLVGRSLNQEFYRKNVVDPKPSFVKDMPLWGSILVQYLTKIDASQCQNTAKVAAVALSNNRIKMKAYAEAVDAEDKPIILASIKRMADILAKVNSSCGA